MSKTFEQMGQTERDLRDRFAMAALPALVTSALDENHKAWDATAQHTYLIADAMLKERQQ